MIDRGTADRASFGVPSCPGCLFLAAVMIVGWVLVWNYAQKLNQAAEPDLTVDGQARAGRAGSRASSSRRSPTERRSNSAITRPIRCLLERARGRTPNELAAVARRDVLLAHLWQTPEHYRGVPVHLLGTALRVLRYQSKLSPNGWLYEAWIITPETTRAPYVCVFEDAPEGFPIGPNVSERVVFNGYFLKIMKYQAADTARRSPGAGRPDRLAAERAGTPQPGENSLLRWTLIILGVMFFASLVALDLPAPALFESHQTIAVDHGHAAQRRDRPGQAGCVGSLGCS